MTLDDSDKQRIAGRRWAEESIEEAMNNGKDFFEGFTRAVKRVFAAELRDPDVMSDVEAIAFEKEEIAFGKHKGTTWGEAPESYISWMADSNIPLMRYVRSQRFRNREA